MSKFALLALLWGISAHAKMIFQTSVEPLFGYERVQKTSPAPDSTDRLVYGGRVSVGYPLVSLEAEYTRASDSVEFPSLGITTRDAADKAKLGVRSTLEVAKRVGLVGRAGAQMTRNVHEEVVGGVSTRTEEPLRYNPYGGAGVRVHLGGQLSVAGDVVVVFTDLPNMTKNEYQTTLGFAVHF